MNYIIADHIISPLAVGSEPTLVAVLAGRSALRVHTDAFPCVEPFCASRFEEVQWEQLCIDAVKGTNIDSALLASPDTLFVLSTTKGNVSLLAETEDILLHDSARRIARAFANPNEPIVVSNACISGVCALITAQRLLDAGTYRHAVVVGSDVLSAFIVSGFQSFKALSPSPCKPFDAARQGLNLGEAAACMVLTADEQWANRSYGSILSGAIHNDANHISAPSRTGEGSYRCLREVMGDRNDLAFINVHGTATLYNDEMESVAIHRADLSDIPVNALKGYFGHTLGAAGLLETILSLHALRRGLILGTRGYQTPGTTHLLNIDPQTRTTNKREFIKLLSGFGGCNAAIRVTLDAPLTTAPESEISNLKSLIEVHITPNSVTLNGAPLKVSSHGGAMLTELYRAYVGDYPKYFKMDPLARLGFVASELLLGSLPEERFVPRADRAIILANRSSCLANDREYQRTIMPDNYYPSPSVFVYTLPNIVTGEIAIRNSYYGETSFYVMDNESQMDSLVSLSFAQKGTQSALTGWIECHDADHFEAHLKLITKI